MLNPITIGVLLVFGLAIASADQMLLPEALSRVNQTLLSGFENLTEITSAYAAPIAYVHSLAWLLGIGLGASRGRLAGLDYLFIIMVNTATSGISYIASIEEIVRVNFLKMFQPTVQNDLGAAIYFALPFLLVVGMLYVALWSNKRRKVKLLREKEEERERLKQEIKEEVKRELGIEVFGINRAVQHLHNYAIPVFLWFTQFKFGFLPAS